MSEHMSPIPSRIYNAAVEGHVTGADQIIDDVFNKTQDQINSELIQEQQDIENLVEERTGNKEYAPADFSGLGKVTIPKHIVEVESVEHNYLYQDDFKKGEVGSRVDNENTVFVIEHDFELYEDITIPANCVLEFDGGSISGAYTITGTNTGINAGLAKIFDTNVIFAGTWNVVEAYPEWFGAVGDNVSNDYVFLNKTIDVFDRVYLKGKYVVNNTIAISKDKKEIYSNGYGKIIQTANVPALIIGCEEFFVHDLKISVNSEFTSSVIKLTRNNPAATSSPEWNRKLISHVSLSKPFGSTETDSIGILFEDSNSYGVYNITVENCNIYSLATAIYFKASPGFVNSNTVCKCFFYACRKAIKASVETSGMIVNNNVIACAHQNGVSLVYESPQNAIDIIPSSAIYDNNIDVYFWDFSGVPGAFGSCFGNIGLNKYTTPVSKTYSTTGYDLFVGALPSNGSIGRTRYHIRITGDTLSVELNLLLRSDNTFILNNVSYTLNDAAFSMSYDLELYYIKINGVSYLYLRGLPQGYFAIELLNDTSVIVSYIEVKQGDIDGLVKICDIIPTIGNLTIRKNPARYTLDGFCFFDRTNRKPLYWDANSNVWKDATGTPA